MSVLGYSLYPVLKRSFPKLLAMLQPVAEKYAQIAGYDDLLPEEYDVAQKALGRLSERDSMDRVYRLKRGHHLAAIHQILPKEEWTKPEDDVPYLSPIIKQLEEEAREKEYFDTLKVVRVHPPQVAPK